MTCPWYAAEAGTPLVGSYLQALRAPDEALEWAEIGAALRAILMTLPPREERVLRLRFGLGANRERTLAEVARMDGVTSGDNIRRIEIHALRRIRYKLWGLNVRFMRGVLEGGIPCS